MKWLKTLKGRLRFNEPLSKHTSFRIGGSASILFEPKDTFDLINCLRKAKQRKIPYFVIGNGTNLLIRENGFSGIVIKLNSLFFKQINLKGNILNVGSGVGINDLIEYLSKTKLSGYEFLAGVPGSIGGALVMNAGITINQKRYNISQLVNKIKVLDRRGKIINLHKKAVKFGYRRSNLNKYIILQAQFKLNKDDVINKENRIKNLLSHRISRLDYSKPNIGCIFKNPSANLSAGALIDRCGLKGLRYGGAMISKKHANFILNFNQASADDVINLINIVKKKVQDEFGIKLREEIKIVP